MARLTRDHQMNFRVSEEEHARVKLLADHYEMSVSAVLRWLVKREAEKIAKLGRERVGSDS